MNLRIPESAYSSSAQIVPISELQGIQKPEEFSANKLRKLSEFVEQYGAEFFQQVPVICTTIVTDTKKLVAVLDGHYRSRIAPKFEQQEIAAVFVDINELAQVNGIPVESLTQLLLQWIDEVQGAFAELMILSGKIYDRN